MKTRSSPLWLLRLASGLGQDLFAAMLGISRTTLWRIESGRRALRPYEMARALRATTPRAEEGDGHAEP